MHLGVLARGPAHSLPGRRFLGTGSTQTDSHTPLQTPLLSFSWQMLSLQSWHKGDSKYTSWQAILLFHSELPRPWTVLGKDCSLIVSDNGHGRHARLFPITAMKRETFVNLCLQTRSQRRHFKDFCLVVWFWPYISTHQLYGFLGGVTVYIWKGYHDVHTRSYTGREWCSCFAAIW